MHGVVDNAAKTVDRQVAAETLLSSTKSENEGDDAEEAEESGKKSIMQKKLDDM